MNKKVNVSVFGATGKVGNHFVRLSLDAGYDIRALIRNESKFKYRDNPRVQAVLGDVTKLEDVAKVIKDANVVVSCLGNVGNVHIMEKAHSNILDAAAKLGTIPRCIFISTVGCGGTSWLIKRILTMIGGKTSIADYEAADKRVREETRVPRLLVRPYALTDKPAKGTYKIIEKQSATFAKPITRADVAKFFVAAVENTTWDGSPGIQLAGK